jgi:hypothetical protein
MKNLPERLKGRHDEREIIVLCVRWYLQAQLSRLGGNDGRARAESGAHDHPALGAALRAGVRQTLEPIRCVHRPVVAHGRNLRQAARPLGLSVSRLGPMLGLKSWANAGVTIAGIELMHRVRKGQFKLAGLGLEGRTTSGIWAAVLGA